VDLNIQFDAGGVTGDLKSAETSLRQIKALVESTEPFGTHLAKGSKVEIDSLLAQMRNLATQVEGSMGRVRRAMRDAEPKELRKALEETAQPLRQITGMMRELGTAKFSGMGAAKAAQEVRQLSTSVHNLTESWGRASQSAAMAGATMEATAARATKAAQAAGVAARSRLDASVAAATNRLNAFIQNHPAAQMPPVAGLGAARSSQTSLSAANAATAAASSAAHLQMASAAATTATNYARLESAQARLNALKAEGAEKSGKLTRAMGSQARMSNDLHSAYRGLASGFGAMWLTWGNALPLLAGAGLSHSVTQAVRQGAEVGHTLASIGALGEVAAADVDKLNEAIMRTGRTSTYGPAEAAEALKTLSLAGLNAQQQLQALPSVLDFAKVGEVPLQFAAENLVAVGTAYGYSADQYQRVGDIIAKAAAVSMASVTDMSGAFRQSTAVAQMYGVALEDTAVGLALLAQSGIRGTMAGTSLRQMYNELAGSTVKARKALDELGISIFDNANNRVRPMGEILNQVSGALAGLDFETAMRKMQEFGNERGLKMLSAGLQAVAREADRTAQRTGEAFESVFSRLLGEISNSSGFMAAVATEMDQSTSSLMKRVGATLSTTLVGAFQVAEPAVRELMHTLREALGDQTVMETVAGLIRGVTGLATAVVSLTTTLAPLLPWAASAAAAYGILRAAMAAWNAVVQAGTASMSAMALSAANTATAKAALAAGATSATAAMTGVGGAAGIAAAGVRGLMGAIFPLLGAVSAAIALWQVLRGLWNRGGDDAKRSIQDFESALGDLERRNEETRQRIYNQTMGLSPEAASTKVTLDALYAKKQAALDAQAADLNERMKAAMAQAREWDGVEGTSGAAGRAQARQEINAIERQRAELRRQRVVDETRYQDALRQTQALGQAEALQVNQQLEAARRQGVQYGEQAAGMAPEAAKGGRAGRNVLADETRELQAAQARLAALQEEIHLRERFPNTYDKMTDAAKRVHLLQVQLNASTIDGARALTEQERAAKLQELATLQQVVGLEKYNQSVKEYNEGNRKLVEDTYRTADSTRQKAEEMQAANAVYGKSKVAVEEYRLAELKQRLAMADASDRFLPEYVRALMDAVEAQQMLTDATRDAEVKAFQGKLDEQTRDLDARVQAFQDEARLAGLSALERAKVVAVRKVELDYAKKLADLDKAGFDEQTRNAMRSQLLANQAKEEALAVSEVIRDDFQKTADSINQSLTDALMRGFEDGKGFGKNFADTLKNMFRTLVLRPVISFIVQPIGNLLSGVVGDLVGKIGGGLFGNMRDGGVNPLGMLSNVNSLSSAWGLASNWLGFGSGAASGSLALGNAASLLGGDGLGTFVAANGGWGTMGGSAALSSAAGMAAIAAPLIIGALVERNSRDRFSGAAYATTGGGDPLSQVIGGSTDFNYMTGDLPDRAALLARLEELGAPMEAISDWNDRALSRLLIGASSAGEFGINWKPMIRNFEGEADFYRGAGYAHPEAMGWWDNKGNGVIATDPRVVEASRNVALSIIEPLEAMGRLIGDEATYRATVGFANRGEGKGVWAGFELQRDGQDIAEWVNKDDYHSVGEGMQAMYSSAMEAMAELDLPEWARNQVTEARAALDALEGENVGQESAAMYAQTAAGVEQMYSSIQTLIDIFPDFSSATQDSVFALQELMGGMDALQSSYSSYLQNFWSEEERAALTRKQLEADLGAVGLALPATREEFRALVEAQDLTTEAGRKAFAALMGAAGAFAEVTSAAEDAAQALADAQSAAKQRTDDVWQQLHTLFAEQISNWRTLANEAKSIFDMATSAARDLRGDVSSTRDWEAARSNAMIDQALAAARASGVLPDADDLRHAIAGARAGLDMDGYASVAEYERDQLVLAGKLAELGDVAGGQMSFAEQQVRLLEEQRDYWKKQIDQLRRTDLTITSIDEGVTYLANALRAEEEAKAAAAEAAASASASAGGGKGVGYGQFGPGGTPAATDAASYTQYGLSWEEVLAERDRYAEQGLRSYAYRTALSPYWTIRAGVAQERPMAAVEFEQFANGGLHTGGLRLVGERGPELEFTGPARYWSFEQSQRMLSGGGARDEERLASLLQAVLRELGAIRADTKEISDLEFRLVSLVRRVTGEGNAMRTQEVPA
jgi:TP901 family phage tail tape measure protein